jgi:hypothetical protein
MIHQVTQHVRGDPGVGMTLGVSYLYSILKNAW